MANPPIGGLTAVIRWTNVGDVDTMVSTCGIIDNTPGRTPATIANLVDVELFQAGIIEMTNMCVGWAYQGTTIIETTADGSIVGEKNVAVAGTRAISTCPSNCALLIKKLTSEGGRRNRGRFYFPAAYLPETEVDSNGTISSGEVSSWQVRFNNFLTGLGEQQLAICIWHELPPSTGTVVTSLQVQSKIATQRRRMR